jgi:hypothetical protein
MSRPRLRSFNEVIEMRRLGSLLCRGNGLGGTTFLCGNKITIDGDCLTVGLRAEVGRK